MTVKEGQRDEMKKDTNLCHGLQHTMCPVAEKGFYSHTFYLIAVLIPEVEFPVCFSRKLRGQSQLQRSTLR